MNLRQKLSIGLLALTCFSANPVTALQHTAQPGEAMLALGKAHIALQERFKEIGNALEARAFELLEAGNQGSAKAALTWTPAAWGDRHMLDIGVLECGWFATASCDADRARAREAVIKHIRSVAKLSKERLARPTSHDEELERRLSELDRCQAESLAALVEFGQGVGIREVAEIIAAEADGAAR